MKTLNIYIYAVCIIMIAACVEEKSPEKVIQNIEKQDSISALGEMAKDSINKGWERYDVKSGYVKYKAHFGDGKVRTRELQFDLFGARQLKTIHNAIFLERDGFIYSINPVDSVGTKTYSRFEDNFNPDMIDIKSLNDVLKRQYHYEEKGVESILGRKCKIVSLENREMNVSVRYWIYKYLPLKMEIKIMRDISVIEAESFEENKAIDPEIFAIPKKIKFVKVDK